MNIKSHITMIIGFSLAETLKALRLIIAISLGIVVLKWLIGDWKNAIEAISHLGTVLLGLAALYGVDVFAGERKRKRSDAAAFILAKIRKGILEILKVADERSLYQIPCYPTKLISDGTQDERDWHPERPARMITQIAMQLKIDLCEPSASLPIHTVENLNIIIEELQKECKNLASAVYEQLKDTKYAHTIEFVNSTLADFKNKFIALDERAKSLLVPIIERGE